MSENKSNFAAEPKNDSDDFFKVKAAVFLTSVGGMAALVSFGATYASARRKDTTYFDKGLARPMPLAESGASLAMRALGWGTLYAVGGVGLICFGIWKLSGAQDLKEFRTIMGSVLPRISKKESTGRTEFEGLNDLLQYVISESENKKPKV